MEIPQIAVARGFFSFFLSLAHIDRPMHDVIVVIAFCRSVVVVVVVGNSHYNCTHATVLRHGRKSIICLTTILNDASNSDHACCFSTESDDDDHHCDRCRPSPARHMNTSFRIELCCDVYR